MNIQADLHLHTTASDGTWTPKELVDQVQRAGIGLFAVTDHDSLGSLARVAQLARGSGLRFLPGVELSARLDGQWYHLLAYGFDPTDPALAALAAANEAKLIGASDTAVRLLAEAGYPLSLEEYAAYTWDRRRGGWKAFNYLQDRGLCATVSDYFDGLFHKVPHPQAEFPPPDEVIATARKAGGVVVLAHPGAYFSNGIDTQCLDRLVDRGVQGLECYTCHHTATQTETFLAYCRARDLLVTGGSDCHGAFAGRALGVPPIKTSDLNLGPLEAKILT